MAETKVEIPKLLVVGADVLFSFFNKNSDERRLIVELPNRDCKLVTLGSAMEELVASKEKIMESVGIDELEFESLLSLLRKNVETVPKSEYEKFLPEAQKIFTRQQ